MNNSSPLLLVLALFASWRLLRIGGGRSRAAARLLVVFSFFLFAPSAFAISGWFDASFRRPIDVIPDADHPAGFDLAYAEFFAAGHLNPDGSDLRVATDEGRQVPAKVLRVGPGDKLSLIFSPIKGVKKYFAYFGNPTPTPNKPAFDEVKIEGGLLMEMHQWTAAKIAGFEQVEEAWAKAGPLIGRTMIDAPFYGINPFGTEGATISKITGSLFAPLEGDYIFSAFVEDHGGLYIDGAKALYINPGRADVSQQAKIHLKRGRHEFVFYHLTRSGAGRFTVAWQRPAAKAFEVIPRASFGVYGRGNVGPLEELRKPTVADFTALYAGEAFYADDYSHHFVFTAREPRVSAKGTYEWDFGDGQTAAGSLVEHVYLTDGVYPVKLSVRLGANSDSQTTKLAVSRDWPNITNPATDKVGVQSLIVASYKVARIPDESLPRACWLHERGGNIEAMLRVATQLAGLTRHPNADLALAALVGASRAAAIKNNAAGAVKMWGEVPADSDLQPRAAAAFARLLLWQTGDIARAVQVLEPYSKGKDPALIRLYGQALVLNQKAADGRTILQSFPLTDDPTRRAARSGALARTIEYYIQTKDWETGEEQWDNWQQQYPADFLEGYSVVLKMKLMELKGAPQGAAAVAEAFAKAVPGSSYAPQLLFRAGKLLEFTDPGRSQALVKLLKERYPEDPLAQ